MKIRVALYTLLALIIIVLQTTLLEYLTISGVKPNLVIIFIVCSALLNGSLEGAITGIAIGLAIDMVSGKLLGFNSLLGMYTGIAVGSLNKRIYKENVLVVMVAVFLITIIYEWFIYFSYTLFNQERALMMLNPFTSVILPEAVYNSVISVIFYILMLRINRKTFELKSDKDQ